MQTPISQLLTYYSASSEPLPYINLVVKVQQDINLECVQKVFNHDPSEKPTDQIVNRVQSYLSKQQHKNFVPFRC